MADLSLGSKLVFKEVNQFVEKVTSLLSAGEKKIYINMESCQYLNSLMLSGLIRAQKNCDSKNCQMILQKVSAPAMTLFETTNVLSLFTIEGGKPKRAVQDELHFSYRVRPEKIGIFVLKGSLNSPEQCSQLRDFYEKHIITVDHGILDCQELEHLGSAGVTEMFRLRGLFEEKSGKLIIVSRTDSVESIWRMMHLDTLIPKADSLEEAGKLLST